MSEEILIQCPGCGVLYSNLEDRCPYCGEPQPSLSEDPEYHTPLPEQNYDEPPQLHISHMVEETSTAENPLPEESFVDDYRIFTGPTEPADSSEYDYEEAHIDPAYYDKTYDEAYSDAYEDEYLPEAEPWTEEEQPVAAGYVGEVDAYDQEYLDEYADGYEDEYDQHGHREAFEARDLDSHHASYGPSDDIYQSEDSYQPESESSPRPRRFTWRRMALGCLSTFLCLGLFYGSLGLLAVRKGLAERALVNQAESEEHYQRGQEHLANESIDLAIAEFEMAISINPNFLEARQALRDAQRIARAQPTPTSQTRSAAAANIYAEAQALINIEDWFGAAEKLSQVRDLDANYRAEQVSDLIYQANYELGLQLIVPDKLEEAITAFERALAEQPDDAAAAVEKLKATLYLAGIAAEENSDYQETVETFSQLYNEDNDYLDVRQRLRTAYERMGDELAQEESWCLAEASYTEAHTMRASDSLQAKLEESSAWCEQEPVVEQASPTPRTPQRTAATVDSDSSATAQATPTTAAETETGETTPANGFILFSAFNPGEARWEILSVPANGGAPRVLVTEATMPALSPNSQLLLYHSERADSEGFHIFDLTTGEDKRITLRRRDVLPRWGGNNTDYLFVSLQPGSNRWQIHHGFADGKSDPIIIRDGRTPDWSPDNNLIAYQGTDPQGNNPGIYLAPFGGGEASRITTHESDRSPVFSPDGTQLAYMSTRSGNWDIYTISASGGEPRQITTNPSNDGLPVWSPDGSQIAYVSDAGGNWAIYTISAGGGAPQKVIDWDGNRRSDWLMSQIWWGR